MPKKQRSAKQLANDERLRNKSKGGSPAPKPSPGVIDTPDVDLNHLQRQIDEIMEKNTLLTAALLNKDNSVEVGKSGKLVGEVDKYLVDPENYPDPTPRLAKEARLETIAFNHNYLLDYDFSIRAFENKMGVNMREPEFLVTLYRIKLDDQGNRVKKVNPKTHQEEDVLYIARRLMFHEDPQAALVIARENNLDVDKSDEKVFLNEMRYLRVRDWLFGVLWATPADETQKVQEETLGGTIVQFITRASEAPSALDFDQVKTKV